MAIYHVDNSGADGDGSEGSPWNNIAGHIGLSGGDLMYIRGDAAPGRVYTEAQITCANSGSSGDGNDIVLMPYPGEYAIIQSSGVSSTILRVEGDYWTFDGLKFDGNGYDTNRHIWLYGCSHIDILNCESWENGGDAAFEFADGNNPASYVTIDNCTIYNTYKADDADSAGIGGGAGSYIDITNNTIYDCRGDCVVFWHIVDGTVTYLLVEDNHLYTTLGKCSENAVDLKRGTDVTIRGNIMHGFRYCDATCGGSSGGIGEAMLTHNECDDALIEDNLIYDCASGISIWSNTDEVIIQHNIIRDLVTDGATWLNAGIYIHANAGHDVKIYNNTFHELPQHLFYLGEGADTIIRNNICDETHDIYEDVAVNSVDADYNGWYNVVDSIVGAHDTTGSDPSFRDEGNNDYHIRRGSSAVNAGVDVGLDYIGSAPDLGAYEHRRLMIAGVWA